MLRSTLRCGRSLDRLLSQAVRQGKDVLRLEQEREKLASELSEAQNMYMQSLEDIKVRQTRAFANSLQGIARGYRGWPLRVQAERPSPCLGMSFSSNLTE